MSVKKYQEIQCNQTGMAQNASLETSKGTQPYHGIIMMGLTEAMSSFELSPSSQSYQYFPKAACGIEYLFHSPQVSPVNTHQLVIDFLGRRRKRTESEIIGELQKQINELRFEVSRLKQQEKFDNKIHYIEIRELPFTEVKNQVLEYYKTHDELYPDEIAVSLGLDLESVMKAVYELKSEGELEVVR